jgi:Nineteen complex-related protein 2
VSFNPNEAEATQNDTQSDTDSRTSTPIRASNLARHVLSHGTLLRHSIAPSPGTPNPIHLRSTSPTPDDRPTYSKDYLNELRNSTPSTPKDLSSYNSSVEEDDDLKTLDLISKFGEPSASTVGTGPIPTEAEIREKKERRARLALEHEATGGQQSHSEDFIPLEDYDSDGEFKPRRMQVSAYLQKEASREEETRLVRDDEDIAEGFDDFVEDAGRVTLSRKARREQEKKQREGMRELIEQAEDSSEESDSEAEANEAYEIAQSRAGMDGLRLSSGGSVMGSLAVKKRAKRTKEPTVLTKIPRLGDVVKGLRERLREMEDEKTRMGKKIEELDEELVDIKSREEDIQQKLIEAGDEFERMKKEVEEKHGGSGLRGLLNTQKAEERGLESLGGTPGPAL